VRGVPTPIGASARASSERHAPPSGVGLALAAGLPFASALVIASALVLVGARASAGLPAPQTGNLRLDPPPGGAEGESLAPLDRLPGSDSARDETGEGRAFVEVVAPRARGYVGELLRLEVRFGFEAEFLEGALIPLFRRQLDLPVQLEAAWLDEGDAPDLARAFGGPAPEDAVSVARNDRVARARRLQDRVVGGRTFRVYALDALHVERAPGVLRLASPRLVYAHAAAFRDDFVHGRTPTERRDGYVVGPDVEIGIDALPASGRPDAFSGAVGDFRIDLRVDESADPGGASTRCEITIHGDGDLGDARVPDSASFAGFRVLGVLDDRGRARRTLIYDLERRYPEVRRIPPVAFHYFDPRPPGAYRTASTPAFDLPELAPGIPGAPVEQPAPFGLRVLLLGAAAALALAVVAGVAARVRRRGRPAG